MLEKFLKGTYSFERQLGKNIVFSKDEIAIIHKRKAFCAVYGIQRSPFCFRTAVFRNQRPPIF